MHSSPAAQPLHPAFNCKERGGRPIVFSARVPITLTLRPWSLPPCPGVRQRFTRESYVVFAVQQGVYLWEDVFQGAHQMCPSIAPPTTSRLPALLPSIQGRRNSGSAAGSAKELRAMQIYKKQKNRCNLCLFLFSNNDDLKNNTRNYRKPFWNFWVREYLQ